MEWLGHIYRVLFNFLRNCQTDSQRSCTTYVPTCSVWELQLLHMHASLCHGQFFYFILPILIVVLISISLETNNIEYPFMCLFFIRISLVKCLFYLCSFEKMSCSFSYHWVLRALYIFRMQVLYETWFVNISSSLWLVFSFSIATFIEQKFLILISPIYYYFSFMDCAFSVVSKKSLSN